jgi:hypothetical protein
MFPGGVAPRKPKALHPADEESDLTVLPETLHFKTKGARSTKAIDWLEEKVTAASLTAALYACQPCERLLFKLFQIQTNKTWLSRDRSEWPAVQFANLAVSPAVVTINEYSLMLISLPSEALCNLDGKYLSTLCPNQS